MSICEKCVYYSACDYEDENDGDTCDYFKMRKEGDEK